MPKPSTLVKNQGRGILRSGQVMSFFRHIGSKEQVKVTEITGKPQGCKRTLHVFAEWGFSPFEFIAFAHARARRIELSQGDHAHANFDDSCLNEVIKPLSVFAFVVFALVQLLTGVTKPHFNVVRGIKPVALHNPCVNGKIFNPRAHDTLPVIRVPQASGNLPIRKELHNTAGLEVLRAFPYHRAHQMIAAHSAVAVFQNP